MDWWTHVVAFVAGLGAGWTLKVIISSRSSRTSRTTFVSQRDNEAKGDIVAGDKHTNSRPPRP
ncbi:hypothetical protein D3C71_1811340 [compost metagenome]